MDKATIAILISVASAMTAATSLAWNIYRDVLLKPRVNFSFAQKRIYFEGQDPSPPYIGMKSTNHGPGSVALHTVLLKQTSVWRKMLRKEKHAVLSCDHTNPYSGQLPKKLEVGETLDLFVDYDKDCFLKVEFTHLGIYDSFGRTHWGSRRSMKDLKKSWISDFGQAASSESSD